jgi:pectate lyase
VQVVGYGAGTTGGQGGRLYTVSNWAEFRSALLASGPRIVAVSGSANLDGGGERLVIDHGNLTIDGSRWSGSLKRYSLVLRASNVIITQMRLRPGDQLDDVGEGDGLTINPGDGGSLSNIVIDHCSLLWAPDVTLAILNRVSNVTVQHSIIAAGLYYSANPSSPNGYGVNVTTIGKVSASQFGARVTLYRNYLAHNNQRNLRGVGTLGIEYVNNVFYNWGAKLGHANPQGMNVVGNVFKKGPDSTASAEVYATQLKENFPQPYAASVWWADNLGLGFTPTMDFGYGVRRDGPWDGGLHGVSAAPASSALADTVVSQAGPGLQDAADARLKSDWAYGAGSFYNGIGYAGPNPTWQ